MVKRLFVLVILLSTFVFSYSQQNGMVFQSRGVHANPNLTSDYKQPDGSVVTIIMNGDAVVHWASTTDGYTLLMNNNNAFEYAKQDSQGNLVLSGVIAKNPEKRSLIDITFLSKIQKDLRYSKQQINSKLQNSMLLASKAETPKAFPSTGTRKLLMILVNFNNTSTTYTQAGFNNYMNQANYNSTGSFKDFYYENSYGQLTVNTTVTVWVTVPNTHDYYGPDAKWGQFAYDACVAANSTVNFADFDNDGDGTVEGIAIIHQGPGQEESGSTTDIWSHSWDLTSAGYSTTQRTFDGVKVNSYTVQPEKSGGSMATIGVMCHEFGHNMGAPDYYDTDYSTSGQYDGTGYWDVMASGSYNGSPSGSKPAHHNAYTKCYIYGWATPTVLSSATNVTMNNSAQNSNAFYRFNTTTTNEYYLLENRQLVGFDAYLPGHGLIIYHVDGSYISSHMSANDINAGSHQGMYPMSAISTTANGVMTGSGAVSKSGCPFPGTSNKTSFTDATTPNAKSWAGANTAKPLTSIAEASGVITFAFMGGSVTPTAPTATTNAASSITSTSAVLNGSVNNNNAASTTVTFEYGTSTSFGSTINATPNSVTGNTATAVSATISGLTAGTTIYFRVKAVNSVGTTYGATQSFVIPNPPAAVTLPYTENFNASTLPTGWSTANTGTSITERWSVSNTANAGGTAYEMKCSYQQVNPGTTMLISPALNTSGMTSITLNAKYMLDDYGTGCTIKIQKSTDKTTWTDVSGWSLTSSSNTNKTGTITNLSIPVSAAATYIAVVVTGNLYQIDYFYIDNMAFTTAGSNPVLATVSSTTAASSITNTTAITGGNVSADGGASVTERGVCYSTSQNPTTSNSKVASGTGTGSFTCNLSGLTANTTYYVRAYAVNSVGTAYGPQISFTTTGSLVYCASKGSSVSYEWLDYFKLGTLTNTTTANGGYGDFTSMSAPSIALGSTQTVYFSAGFASTAYTEYFKVYIDYNKDGDFADAGELVASTSSNVSTNLSKTFTVPTTALTGTTRLRIVMSDNSATSYCNSYSYGETEDYTVNITAAKNGNDNFLDVVDADEASDIIVEHVALFPVPANQFITVAVNSDEVNAKVTIYSSNGQVVKVESLNSPKTTLEISNLNAGAYTLIYDDGQKTYTKSFIKY